MKNNLGYATKEYSWFIGQVAPDQNEFVKGATWKDAHGDRVKVRIPGKHPKDATVTDDNLPWAIVAKPTSQGNRNGGSLGVWGGEWVIGFFMDESEQVPVITHVLGNNLTHFDLTQSTDGSTYFKRVSRYNSQMTAQSYQTQGGSKPNGPAVPDSNDKASTKLTTRQQLDTTRSGEKYQQLYMPSPEAGTIVSDNQRDAEGNRIIQDVELQKGSVVVSPSTSQ